MEKKKRISSKIINIDKYKDIDGYVSKLTDVINNKIKLINKISETIDHVICEINNETNMVDEIIHKASEMDNDTLHLIDDKLNKIVTQTRKKLKITPKNKAEDKDKAIPKTKTKTIDKDKAIPKTKNKTVDKDKDKDKAIPKTKAKYIYEDIKENRYIRMFFHVKIQGNKKKVIGSRDRLFGYFGVIM